MRAIPRAWLAAALLAGCAGTPQQYSVKEVYICAAEECAPGSQRYSAEQVAVALQQLLSANLGQTVEICNSDPKQRNCIDVGVCHFVQGGLIPGAGCSRSMNFSQAQRGDQAGQVRIKADMLRTFIGVPLVCAPMEGTIQVRTADEITFEVAPHYCNWMGVGNMTATFNLAVEAIDFDRGQMGGYWQHGVAGTGSGAGSGYAILRFPKAMPAGTNWLSPAR